MFSAHKEFIHYTTSMTTYQATLRGRGGKVMSNTESSLPSPPLSESETHSASPPSHSLHVVRSVLQSVIGYNSSGGVRV